MAKKCKFHKIGREYHASGGALGLYRIMKAPSTHGGWMVRWTGGAARKRGEEWKPTLKKAKQFAAFYLGCKV